MCVFILFSYLRHYHEHADIQCYYLPDNLSQYFGIKLADYPELKKLYDDV